MDEGKRYSSGEIVRKFGIVKNTLFKWEREGKIPQAKRDWRGHRYYDTEHLHAIDRAKLKSLEKEMADAVRSDNLEKQNEIHQRLSIQKLREAGTKRRLGFSELEHYRHLADGPTLELLQVMPQLGKPSSQDFRRAVDILAESVGSSKQKSR